MFTVKKCGISTKKILMNETKETHKTLSLNALQTRFIQI